MGMHIIDMAEKVVEENLIAKKLASQLVDDPISAETHILADKIRERKVVEI